jgi:hypothetical protein
MLNAHLFFVKWLGCQIVESSIPISPGVDTFAHAIMEGKAHPNIWIAFGRTDGGWVGASDLDVASFGSGDKSNDYVCRFYCVDSLAVRVRFSSVKLKEDWHPKVPNRFTICDFRKVSD